MHTELEAYIQRTMPACIREGAEPPPVASGTPEEWGAVADVARDYHRAKATLDFVLAVAERGFFPSELASGDLRPGAEIELNTGQVVRPAAMSIDSATVAAARKALHELGDAHVAIDGVLMSNLEAAAYRRWAGDPRAVASAIAEATAAVAKRRAEVEAGRQAEREKPVLAVSIAFSAKGMDFPAGEYRIEPEVADGLRDWLEKMTAEAARRGWASPEGFPSWPPFELLEAALT